MEYMYDSTTASDIPAGATIIAGYVDGLYRWSAGDWVRFPDALHVRVAVSPRTNDGHVIDVETGDATPQQAADWVRMRRAAGLDNPMVYCSRSLMAEVNRHLSMAGQSASLWVADWTGAEHLVPGSVATQFADPQNGSGGHWDTSVVDDTFRGLFVPQRAPQGGTEAATAQGVEALAWPSMSSKPVAFSGYVLTEDGAVYTSGVYHGGANGKPYFAGRKASRLLVYPDGAYVIVATSGETYGPVF